MHTRFIWALAAVFVLGLLAAPVAATVADKLECSGCVDTGDIHANAVKASKIADNAVHADAISKRSVTRSKIKSGAVTIGKLATGTLMAARVNGSDGALIAGTNGVSSKRTAQGNYEVTMPVNITACALTATHSPPIGEFAGIPFKVVAVPGTP
jgi:hypothetical protein